MRRLLPLLVSTGLLLTGCGTIADLDPLFSPDHGPERTLEISNFVGRIEIEESRFFELPPATAAMATQEGRTIRIDGRQDVAATRCHIWGDGVHIDPPGTDGAAVKIGRTDAGSDLPHLPVIRLKVGDSNLRLIVRDSMLFGTAGDLVSLDVEMADCGELDIGDVAEGARLVLSGHTKVDIDDAPSLDARLTGHAKAIAERIDRLDATLFEQAQIDVDEVTQAGRLAMADSTLGYVDMSSRDFTAALGQTATLRMDRLTGYARFTGIGMSRLEIEDAELLRLDANWSGRGGVDVDGKTVEAILVADDSARMDINEVNGPLSVVADGQSEIRIHRDAALVAQSRIRRSTLGLPPYLFKGPSARYGVPATEAAPTAP